MHDSKKRKTYLSMLKYALISLLVLAVSFLIGALINVILSVCFQTAETAEHIIEMLDGIIGAVAAGLVLFQLKEAEATEKHENDISEASFLLQYNQSFIQDSNMVEVERLLEDQAYYDAEVKDILLPENRQKFVNYLVYLESLAPLVLNGVLTLDYIDNLMSYRFFLALDNAEVQKKEIYPFADYYRGCFKLYRLWEQYNREKGHHVPCDDCTNRTAMRKLSEWDQFEKFSA